METNIKKQTQLLTSKRIGPFRRPVHLPAASRNSTAFAPTSRDRRPLPIRQVRAVKSPACPDDPLTQMVKNDLAQAAEARRIYQSTRSRDAVYSFLNTIFAIGRRWKAGNRIAQCCRLALELQENPPPMYPEVFACLIFCAGQRDDKTRSRWSCLLRVAEAHRATSIQKFVKAHGGINLTARMSRNR
jgi:hypothetical protein